MPSVADLPAFLQQALKCFKNREVVESFGEDPYKIVQFKALGNSSSRPTSP